MEIVKGRYGECRFCDNMNLEFGLPSLKEKSWDLCLTDPPYGINYTNKGTNYNDIFLPLDWFDIILKVCKGLVFTPGATHLYDYILHKKPEHNLRYAYYPGNGKTVHVDSILVYGTVSRISHTRDIKEFDAQKFEGFNHTSPKSIHFWNYYLTKLAPLSVIDPFLGSGTTAEVCESLKIPWLGYEIMEAYKPDIEKRIKRGIEKSKQTNLEAFFT